MVEKLNDLMIKSEPSFYGVDDSDLLNGISADLPNESNLRTLCTEKLSIDDDTIALLEAQRIDVDCLKKMRLEDVDTLFEGQILGPKINFREALILWREEIGLPIKSLRMVCGRKRSSDSEPYPTRSPKYPNFNVPECKPTVVATLQDILKGTHPSDSSYKSYPWPMSPEVLKDILRSSNVGRMILSCGELGSLEKSMQSQLTGIVIDYHMDHDTKITAVQLENYCLCITTLFPHENKNNYHIPRGPTRRNPGGSLYSRFINQKISKKALAIGSGVAGAQ
ncbi:uncharacterized protein LOC129757086 [Uranotaenia lowii]|uniref:uncharacterized protein LOC129757086 n=1 Tax=Uranotaenia lowii TaxID=190385 RepID=UPI00247A49BE|nr:uncharacterized protein LOC129757086 [Uranotaenia lowii]